MLRIRSFLSLIYHTQKKTQMTNIPPTSEDFEDDGGEMVICRRRLAGENEEKKTKTNQSLFWNEKEISKTTGKRRRYDSEWTMKA